jgi:hypothetical protein
MSSALAIKLRTGQNSLEQLPQRWPCSTGSIAFAPRAPGSRRGPVSAVAPVLDRCRQSGYFLSTGLVEAVPDRGGQA